MRHYIGPKEYVSAAKQNDDFIKNKMGIQFLKEPTIVMRNDVSNPYYAMYIPDLDVEFFNTSKVYRDQFPHAQLHESIHGDMRECIYKKYRKMKKSHSFWNKINEEIGIIFSIPKITMAAIRYRENSNIREGLAYAVSRKIDPAPLSSSTSDDENIFYELAVSGKYHEALEHFHSLANISSGLSFHNVFFDDNLRKQYRTFQNLLNKYPYRLVVGLAENANNRAFDEYGNPEKILEEEIAKLESIDYNKLLDLQ